MGKKIAIFILLSLIPAATVFAQRVYTNRDLQRYQGRALQSSLNVKSTRISIDFLDANLYQVLQMIAEVARSKDGVTVFVSPELSGTVTIKATNVPWTEILKDIVQQHNLTVLSPGKKTLLIYAKG